MTELERLIKTEREYEITNCMADSLYFIENFLKVDLDGPAGVMLDTPKIELVDMMENEPLVIGRYPRRFGKTTTLVGFAIHKALFLGQTVFYSSESMGQRLDFLREVSYSYRNLPDWMRQSHEEGPHGFRIGKGRISPITSGNTYEIEGKKFDYLIFDEINRQINFNMKVFVEATFRNNAKMAIVGTFKPDNPVLGSIWSNARTKQTGWASLPSVNEQWKVDTILSLAGSEYSVGY